MKRSGAGEQGGGKEGGELAAGACQGCHPRGRLPDERCWPDEVWHSAALAGSLQQSGSRSPRTLTNWEFASPVTWIHVHRIHSGQRRTAEISFRSMYFIMFVKIDVHGGTQCSAVRSGIACAIPRSHSVCARVGRGAGNPAVETYGGGTRHHRRHCRGGRRGEAAPARRQRRCAVGAGRVAGAFPRRPRLRAAADVPAPQRSAASRADSQEPHESYGCLVCHPAVGRRGSLLA